MSRPMFARGEEAAARSFLAGRIAGWRDCLLPQITARHVVRAHGGDVSVESVEGQGSTFRVMLPLDSVDNRLPSRGAGR